MLSKKLRAALPIIVALILFLALRLAKVDLSWSQVLVLPFLFFGFWRLRIFGQKIPTAFLLFATVISLSGFIIISSVEIQGNTGLYMAWLAGDELEAQTRSLRIKLNSNFKRVGNLKVSREPTVVSRGANFKQIMHADAKEVLIWGDTTELKVRFLNRTGQTFREIIGGEIEPNAVGEYFLDFVPVTSVPTLKITIKPEDATVTFLSFLFLGIFGENGGVAWRSYGLNDQEEANRILYLEQAANQISSWPSMSHRAYPLWLKGTYHLFQSLKSKDFQNSEWECSYKAFKRANKYLDSPKMNPELFSAIAVNRAILNYIKGILDSNRSLIETAKNEFVWVREFGNSTKRRDSLADRNAWKAAYRNLMIMAERGEYREPKLKKKQIYKKANKSAKILKHRKKHKKLRQK